MRELYRVNRPEFINIDPETLQNNYNISPAVAQWASNWIKYIDRAHTGLNAISLDLLPILYKFNVECRWPTVMSSAGYKADLFGTIPLYDFRLGCIDGIPVIFRFKHTKYMGNIKLKAMNQAFISFSKSNLENAEFIRFYDNLSKDKNVWVSCDEYFQISSSDRWNGQFKLIKSLEKALERL